MSTTLKNELNKVVQNTYECAKAIMYKGGTLENNGLENFPEAILSLPYSQQYIEQNEKYTLNEIDINSYTDYVKIEAIGGISTQQSRNLYTGPKEHQLSSSNKKINLGHFQAGNYYIQFERHDASYQKFSIYCKYDNTGNMTAPIEFKNHYSALPSLTFTLEWPGEVFLQTTLEKPDEIISNILLQYDKYSNKSYIEHYDFLEATEVIGLATLNESSGNMCAADRRYILNKESNFVIDLGFLDIGPYVLSLYGEILGLSSIEIHLPDETDTRQITSDTNLQEISFEVPSRDHIRISLLPDDPGNSDDGLTGTITGIMLQPQAETLLPYAPYYLDTYYFSDEVLSKCPGYGLGLNDTLYNYFQFQGNKILYIQKLGKRRLKDIAWRRYVSDGSIVQDSDTDFFESMAECKPNNVANILVTGYDTTCYDDTGNLGANYTSNDKTIGFWNPYYGQQDYPAILRIRDYEYGKSTECFGKWLEILQNECLIYELRTPIETDVTNLFIEKTRFLKNNKTNRIVLLLKNNKGTGIITLSYMAPT